MPAAMRDRNRTIDFLKGSLALFVITLHYPFETFPFWLTFLFRFCLQFAVPGFMFLSGYTQALSLSRRGISTLEAAYERRILLPKLLRFCVPYTFFYLFEYILFRLTGVYTVSIFKHGILSLFFDFLTGGKGQGGYYTPIVLQLLLLFPVIYFIILRKGAQGLLLMFFCNLFFEIFKQACGMVESEYRLLIFRYLFLIACGCFTALWEKESKPFRTFLLPLSMLAGIGFLILFQFTSYGEHAKIITMWQGTSVLTALYIAPIFYFLVRKAKLAFLVLEVIGRASFHVFLVQMLYYHYWHSYFKDFFAPLPGYLITLVVCTALGVLFWALESRLRVQEKILALARI